MTEFHRYTYNNTTCMATRRRPSTRDDKKYMRTVRYDGSERVVHYGDPDMPMQRQHDQARENFLARHNCADKRDPFAPGFWACYDWQNRSEGKRNMTYRIDPDNVRIIQQRGAQGWRTYKTYDTEIQARTDLFLLLLQAQPLPAARSAVGATSDIAPDAIDALDDVQALYRAVYARVLDETSDQIKARLAAQGMVRRARMRLAAKSADEVIIGGWAILFGDATMTDLLSTYFDETTDFAIEHYKTACLWYEHGDNRDYGLQPVGQRTNALVYPHGIWLEHVLYRDHPLYTRTRAEISDGRLSYSTDSVQHLVAEGFRETDGKLRYWPLVGCSLTARPAEPGLGTVVLLTATQDDN